MDLTELEERAAENPNVKINILYDIACTLTKHLQVSMDKGHFQSLQLCL